MRAELKIQNHVERLKLKTYMRRKAILNVYISYEIDFYSREINNLYVTCHYTSVSIL